MDHAPHLPFWSLFSARSGIAAFFLDRRLQAPRYILAFLSLLGFAGVTFAQNLAAFGGDSADKKPSGLAPDIERVLWWLPEETESIVVSRGSPRVPVKTPKPQPPANPEKTYLVSPEGTLVYPNVKEPYEDLVADECIEPLAYTRPLLCDVEEQLKFTLFTLRPATLFVKAMRWSPKEGREICELILFRDKSADRFIEEFAPYSKARAKVGDHTVLEIDMHAVPAGGPPKNFYTGGVNLDLYKGLPLSKRWLAAPQPDVYVAASSLDLLRTILGRMQVRGPRRAFPDELGEWKLLDVSAPAWGLRHYRPLEHRKDRLSLLNWDKEALGLVFFGANKPEPTLVVRYLSTNKKSDEAFREMQLESLKDYPTDRTSLPPFQRVDESCTESRTRIHTTHEEMRAKPLSNFDESASLRCMDLLFFRWLGFPSPNVVSLGGYEQPD